MIAFASKFIGKNDKTKKLWDRFPLKVDKAEFIFTPVSMWNPHAVIFCRDMNICWETLDNLEQEFVYGKGWSYGNELYLEKKSFCFNIN